MVEILDRVKPTGIVIPPIARDLAKEASARGIRVFGRQPGTNADEWYTATKLAHDFGDALPYLEALCSPNEPACETPEQVRACNAFDLQFVYDCHAMGKKACVRNWGDGRPGGTWEEIRDLLSWYREAEAAGDFDGRHIYNEPGIAPTHDPEWQYHGGRIAWEQAAFKSMGISPAPSIPTEIGWDRAILKDGEWRGWRRLTDAWDFAQEMRGVYRRLVPYIDGGALFCFGGDERWEWNDVLLDANGTDAISTLVLDCRTENGDKGSDMVDVKENAREIIRETDHIKQKLEAPWLITRIDDDLARIQGLANEIIGSVSS